MTRILVLLRCVSCECSASNDEERLRQRIDTNSVYLYVAAKNAVTTAACRVSFKESAERSATPGTTHAPSASRPEKPPPAQREACGNG